MSDAWRSVEERLRRLGVDPADLSETFVRAAGKGGQNVNKVATCVRLAHAPSGVVIRCETERSQARNRLLARQRLAERLEQAMRDREARERADTERRRRQKRGRSRGAKRRMLREKRRRGEVKRMRRSPARDD